MARRLTLWYLTRDRHFLTKKLEKPFTQHPSEKLDFIVPWDRPITSVAVSGDDYTDGPVCDRLAVVDVDVETAVLCPGIRLLGSKQMSSYEVDVDAIESEKDAEQLWTILESDEFIATNCFATILFTLQNFERLLGRQIEWAFESEQLLVVPRAGEMRNAFYERESGSIQLYYWNVFDDIGIERKVYTSLSHDIVAHEATHAIIDGLFPDLYHASSPESLAIHESFADLVAIVQNIDALVFEASERNVDLLQELGEIAEEFGAATRSDVEFLRSALNKRTLDPGDDTTDSLGYPNLANVCDPHILSQVLTGSVYGAFARFFKLMKGQRFWKLWGAAKYFPVAVTEALNYLPPGELSFVDVARAMLVACEQSKSHAPRIFDTYFEKGNGYGNPSLIPKPDRKESAVKLCDRFARLLRDEFFKRRVVDSRAVLKVDPPDMKLNKEERSSITEDETAARDFVIKHRTLFELSDDADFTVDVEEAIIRRLYCKSRQQILVRVRWESHELVGDGDNGESIVVPVGSCLAIDKLSGQVISLIRSHVSERRTRYRTEFIKEWKRRGVLIPEAQAVGFDGQNLGDVIIAEQTDSGFRLRGSARALHIRGEEW